MSRHAHPRRRPDRLTAVMAALTTALITAGLWAVTHLHDGNDPGQTCHPIPGTSRLSC